MKSLLRMVGLALVLGGLGALVYYFGYFDTSVRVPGGSVLGIERVNNVGLMQQRSDGLLMGMAAAVMGMVLIYLGRDPSIGIGATSKKCPHCAEEVKVEATTCKHCRKEI